MIILHIETSPDHRKEQADRERRINLGAVREEENRWRPTNARIVVRQAEKGEALKPQISVLAVTGRSPVITIRSDDVLDWDCALFANI